MKRTALRDNRREIHQLLTRITSKVSALASYTSAESITAGTWASKMPGSTLQTAMALMAEIECYDEKEKPQFEADLCDFIQQISSDKSLSTFDSGMQYFLKAALKRIYLRSAHFLPPDIASSLISVQEAIVIKKENGSFLYKRLGKLLSIKERKSSINHQLYLIIGIIVSRHWTFGWFRRLFSHSTQIMIPTFFALLDSSSRNWKQSKETKLRKSLANHIISMQSKNGSWAWTNLGTSIALISLRGLSMDKGSRAIQSGVKYLKDLRYRGSQKFNSQCWAKASTWDTAIAADALLAAEGEKFRFDKNTVQALRSSITESGLTEFDAGVSRSDCDSSAVTLTFLSRIRNKKCFGPHSIVETSVERILESVLISQRASGGWGFDPGASRNIFRFLLKNSTFKIFIDQPSPEITARVLLALASSRQIAFLDVTTRDKIDNAIAKGIRYLKEVQNPKGYWKGRWDISAVSISAEVVLAFCAVQEDPKSDSVKKARSWLMSESAKTNLSAVETGWLATGVLASSSVTSIHNDADTITFIDPLIRQITYDNDKIEYAYPLMHPGEKYAAPHYDRCKILFTLSFIRTVLAKGLNNARREILWGHPPIQRRKQQNTGSLELAKIYGTIRSRALWLGGRPKDIGQRIVAHFSVYLDSGLNFTFPLLALHGAGWAFRYFAFLDLFLKPYATVRHPISIKKRNELISKMKLAMDGFKLANRRVLVDTYANYFFTKKYGHEAGAEKIIQQPFLSHLNKLHDSISNGEILTPFQKAELYSTSFQWEQTNSVWPMIEKTIRDINDPFVTYIAFRPIVKFVYFPFLTYLFFSDFTKTEERVSEGWKAYRIAEKVGWAHTERCIWKFKFLPVNLTSRGRIIDQWSTELASFDKFLDEITTAPGETASKEPLPADQLLSSATEV